MGAGDVDGATTMDLIDLCEALGPVLCTLTLGAVIEALAVAAVPAAGVGWVLSMGSDGEAPPGGEPTSSPVPEVDPDTVKTPATPAQPVKGFLYHLCMFKCMALGKAQAECEFICS